MASASDSVSVMLMASLDIAQRGATRAIDDRLHRRLGFRELLLAMPAQRGAALVIGDRLGERPLPALQSLHDFLQFLQRILEGQGGDAIRRACLPPDGAGL